MDTKPSADSRDDATAGVPDTALTEARELVVTATTPGATGGDPPLSDGDEPGTMVLVESGPDAALQAAERALSADPSDPSAWTAKALALLDLGNTEEALDALRRLTEIAPGEANGWVNLGTLLALQGRGAEALGALDRAIGVDETSAEAWQYRGVALTVLARFAEALPAFDRAAELEPARREDPAFVLYRAVSLVGLGRHEEGLEALATVLAQAPDDSTGTVALLYRGAALNGLQRHREALDALEEALERVGEAPVQAMALYQKGLALHALGRSAEAEESLSTAIPLLATHPDLQIFALYTRCMVLIVLGRAQEVVSTLEEPPDHPLLMVAEADALALLGRVAESQALYARAAEPDPKHQGDVWAWYAASQARVAEARHADTLEAVERVVSLNPAMAKFPTLLQVRGIALISLGRFREALDALGGAPEHETTWLLRGMARAGAGESQGALEAFDRSVQLAARSAGTHDLYAVVALTQKGQVLLEMESPREALAVFERALAHAERMPADHPARIAVLLGRGVALIRLKQHEEALASYDLAIQASAQLPAGYPNRSVAWWAKGDLLADLRRHDEALLAHDRALGLEPENVDIMLSKARALFHLEEYGRAYALFEQASGQAADPVDRYSARVGMGLAVSRQERYEQAVSLYRDAIALAGEHGQNPWRAWAALGAAYASLGRNEAALAAFQQGWRLDDRPRRSRDLAVGVGATLLDLGRDQEALAFLNEAKGKAEPDARIDYNLGVALYRLDQPEKAMAAWKAAADRGEKQAAERLRLLEVRRPSTGAWIDFWFGGSVPWYRRALGTLLFLFLLLIAVLPVIRPEALPFLAWLNTGRDWTVVAAPLVVLAALLIAPTLGRVSVGSLELELTPSRPETPPAPGPKPDAVLGELKAIRLTVFPG